MIKAIIVEDEMASRAILKELIQEYCPEIEITGEATRVQEAVRLITNDPPDLVFLDVDLPGESGLALVEHLPTIDFGIIFTTAYDEYALRAFRLSAIDYLLKPIDVDELIAAVEKAKKILQVDRKEHLEWLRNNYKREDPRISIPTTNGFVFVKMNEIMRCEAEGKYTFFFLTNGKKLVTSRNIGEYESYLSEFQFFRIHRSTIVNLSHVRRYIRGKRPILVLDDGTELPVAKSRKDELLDQLGLS
jgi:two-component system LytT family response regulator